VRPRLLALALLAGCYQAELPACQVRCSDESHTCPAGMVCGADDLCHPTGQEDMCQGGPDGELADGRGGDPDAGGGQDAFTLDGFMLQDTLTSGDASEDPCFGLCTGGTVCTAPCNCCCQPTNTMCCLQC